MQFKKSTLFSPSTNILIFPQHKLYYTYIFYISIFLERISDAELNGACFPILSTHLVKFPCGKPLKRF